MDDVWIFVFHPCGNVPAAQGITVCPILVSGKNYITTHMVLKQQLFHENIVIIALIFITCPALFLLELKS